MNALRFLLGLAVGIYLNLIIVEAREYEIMPFSFAKADTYYAGPFGAKPELIGRPKDILIIDDAIYADVLGAVRDAFPIFPWRVNNNVCSGADDVAWRGLI